VTPTAREIDMTPTMAGSRRAALAGVMAWLRGLRGVQLGHLVLRQEAPSHWILTRTA
jgi:hypothetical protein